MHIDTKTRDEPQMGNTEVYRVSRGCNLRGQWLCVGVQIQSKTPCAKRDKKIKRKKKKKKGKNVRLTDCRNTNHRDGVSFSNEHSNVVRKKE